MIIGKGEVGLGGDDSCFFFSPMSAESMATFYGSWEPEAVKRPRVRHQISPWNLVKRLGQAVIEGRSDFCSAADLLMRIELKFQGMTRV